MSLGNMPIRAGFNNFFQAYSATILPIATSIEPKLGLTKFGGGYWILNGTYEIRIYTKRLQRDNVDVQLGNIEREIMRLCCCYTPDQIIGIEDMIYRGHDRIYGTNDDYAKSNWESRLIITVVYHIVNEEPF